VDQHLKLASDQMKILYNSLAKCMGYHEGDDGWLYGTTCMKGKSPKLQYPWEGPYKAVMRVNDVVYRIQRNQRSRMMMVHLNQLSSYQETAQDKWP
jgi:hypothetical protein